MKQIAAELGISISTVSRALNGKTVVKEETRRKILALAEKYSYTPNEIARALQKSSTRTIAVVLPDISETFFGTIVKEIDRVVSRQGYMLLLADTHERADKERNYLDMLYTRRVDGLVLATVSRDETPIHRFLEGKIPVVCIDNIPTSAHPDAITIDNRAASRMAVEYLARRGHREIAAIFGSREETTGKERLEGYWEGLRKAGLEKDPRRTAHGDYKRQSGYEAMKKLLEQRNRVPFTALYVTSEKMTYGALQAIRDAGLRIPEDISVIGFDIHPSEQDPKQKITSLRQPEQAIGRLVGEQLLKRLQPPVRPQADRILLEPFLEEGDTVCSL